ncbi:hypothetical protein [Paracoccus alkanivorans]|nr:hypothetical protein [Paracoccus alkanivorans]
MMRNILKIGGKIEFRGGGAVLPVATHLASWQGGLRHAGMEG